MNNTEREPRQNNQQETKVEGNFDQAPEILGAQMLETPTDGSFIHGLSVFIAWVKSILASKDKN
ncbi:MAG: hypothetical protein A3B10_01260 [Candidatus Doudnabacteria bacterium RIFCSPLOWO2_01_FULL_44_21]|uniref:Uncharacterized protein n=1 Tax=Candidatus Doudnabacteria bacterium RIFCSPLOWO2_01_FULL_44_21 TaxID=1817841 RepID=A0A1F5PXH8_9BACT|nr:MAG: hypothetical protein A3B95_04170 [Candidatus Doudnabacteria bacterium RIFCSPHIGHO2_02_FULL_43_13b]OGE94412.1 MAG: hypothetical protein A3B10_01260 [Candidatus Doudnabacteria bacterium RIFCSPLOWO2_01_FULL_44_21]